LYLDPGGAISKCIRYRTTVLLNDNRGSEQSVNEFVDCVAIATLGIAARKAIYDRGFRNFKIRQS
jgi:hypothetical protein